MQHLRSQHLIVAAVALASFGLGLDEGGFSLGFIAGSSFVIWWVVLLSIGLRLLPRAEVPRPALLAGGSLALLAIWTALSWGWASDNGAVFVEIVRVLSYLGLFVLVVITSGREGPRPWLAGLTIGLMGVVVLALASRFDPSAVSGGFPSSRLNYPIGYWNALGACAAIAITLSAWHAVFAETKLARSLAAAALPLPPLAIYLSGSRGGAASAALGLVLLIVLNPRRFALLSTLLLAGVGGAALVLFAHGQSALVDGLGNSDATNQGRWLLLLAVVVVVVVGVVRGRTDRILMRTAVSPWVRQGALALGLIAFVALIVAENPVQRFDKFKEPPGVEQAPLAGNFSNDNGSGRYQFWRAALDAFAEQPLHGIGAGQYKAWWYEHGSIYWVLQDAHSLLFESAAELGAVGLALVLLFLCIPLRWGWKRRAGPHAVEVGCMIAVFGAGVLSASIDWMWEIPAAFGPVVLMAALLTGPATAAVGATSAAARGEPESRHGGGRIALAASLMLCAWIALWCSGDQLLARVELDRSRSNAGERDFAAAADDAGRAVSLQPWAAEPRLQLGLVQEASGDFAAARSTLRQATERAPDDWQIWFLLSRVEARSGEIKAAQIALARARQLNPRSPFLAQEPDFLR